MNRFKFMFLVCGAVFVAAATKLWIQQSGALSLFEAPLDDARTEIRELSSDGG